MRALRWMEVSRSEIAVGHSDGTGSGLGPRRVEALDDVANVIVQILRVVLDLLVRLINLFVELLKSIG